MAFNDMFKVFENKYVSDEEIEKIPSYMFCKWLGNHPGTVLASNEINKYYNEIPMVNQFYLIRNGFKGKKVFIKFLKNNNSDDKDLELIAKFYKISLKKAKEYKSIMSKNEIDYIINIYKDL